MELIVMFLDGALSVMILANHQSSGGLSETWQLLIGRRGCFVLCPQVWFGYLLWPEYVEPATEGL
jgi:hypothetical protein